MSKKMTKKQRKIIESLGWSISDIEFAGDEKGYELSQYSPAGEDFSFSIKADNVAGEVKDYAFYFDPDEHIEMWIEAKRNGVDGVPHIRDLAADADEIADMLDKLADALA